MDELKLVLDIIKSLPEMAIWALVILYFYKIVVIGSVYGVIRYVAGKLYDWGVHKKAEIPSMPKVQEIHFADIFNGVVIRGDETMANLVRQIRRLQAIKSHAIPKEPHMNATQVFIQKIDVDWLRDAIDEKLEREKSQESA